MERSSHEGVFTPQQKIAYAEYLFEKHGAKGRYEGTAEVAKDALQNIDDLQRSERLRIFTLLMQCPEGRLTAGQKKVLDNDTLAPAVKPSSGVQMDRHLLRTYHGLPMKDIPQLLQDATAVIKDEDAPEEEKRFAHVLICAYGERVTESIGWLQKNGDEFSVTEGVRRASSRMKSRWRAQMHIDQALEKVRHPHYRAHLLARRLEFYSKMLCDQEKEYDHRVNESKSAITEAIREAFSTVRRTPGAIVPQMHCYYHMGLLCAEEGRQDTARAMFGKAIELGELYGLSGLTAAARTEMHRVSQPD